jgi:hypothetical protein
MSVSRYAKLFAGASPGDMLGEASNVYAALPRSSDVVGNVRRLLGPELRVIYIVRDPVDRAVSHHHHRVARGLTDPSIDVAVRTDPRLVDYSCYGMQLQPWVDLVGPGRVKVIQFERYIRERRSTLAELVGFIGVPRPSIAPTLDVVHNRSDERRVATGAIGKLSRSATYRRLLRPFLSRRLRGALARGLLSEPSPRPAPPSEATVEFILERTAESQALLGEWFGTRAPTWDLEATRARYREARPS